MGRTRAASLPPKQQSLLKLGQLPLFLDGGKPPSAGATSTPAANSFKANLGKIAQTGLGFQPTQKKSGGLFGMLGGLASIVAMFIPGGQALSAGMLALKAGLAAAPIIGGGLDQLTGLASGGDVTPGQSYIVGERQPELFVPNAAGRIYPSVNMDRKQGGSGEVNFHFNPVTHGLDAESLDRVLNEHGKVFARHFEKWARRENA